MRTEHVAHRPASDGWRSMLARFGLGARGVLYVVLGLLAVQVATGDTSARAASKEGAIEAVARQPLGQWLLGLLTAGLFALAAWRLLQAASGDPVEGDAASDRAKAGAKGVLYLSTAASALGVLLANRGKGGPGSRGASQTEPRAAGLLLDLPGGRVIVAALGLAVMAFGASVVYRHTVKRAFMQRLAVGRMSAAEQAVAEGAGRAGYAALGIVAAAVGGFFVVAGITHDKDDAKGLSEVLGDLAGDGWGQLVLWVVAVGLVLYGLYSFAEARYRRAT